MKNRRQEKICHIRKIAREIFTDKGYAGASTNEIADLSGMSKRSMYYYMGDKETLYASVLREILDEVHKLLDANRESDKTAEQKLRQFIYGVARAGNNRKLNSIVLRELLSGGDSLPEDIPEILDRMFSVLGNILEQGQKDSGFNGMNPVVACLMMLSFFVYWDLVAPLMIRIDKWAEDITALRENNSDSMVDEINRIFLKILKAA